ncbi:MAG: DNA topoisomerase [Nitrososphaerota archaeon]|nr:DNA topoisomerase [Candidatus Calditenuaceae archaeon]MDW8072770.1 DNA topoisomerase [Nitrososphaerota archaeon]
MTLGCGVMQRYIVVAEKRSVARELFRVLRKHGVEATFASVSGHLMDCDLAERFYKWRLSDLLDILDSKNTRLVVADGHSYKRLMKLFSSTKDGILVVATDNDHEGELIGYELLSVYRSVCGENAEFRRMRFNSLEEDELLRAWSGLERDLNWGWVNKAQLRRSFDLLTGAAFTRLLTLSVRRKVGETGVISWGPVQSPSLKFLVDREKSIREFKPEKYWYLASVLRYGEWSFRARTGDLRSRPEAERLLGLASAAGRGVVRSYSEERVIVPRPFPARTDDSLRDLVKITGRSSYSLLGVMEGLYQNGYLSYPRTETNKYPEGFDFERRLHTVRGSKILSGAVLQSKPNPRNGRLSDGAHPPIYPTRLYEGAGLAGVVWEYFARRFVANAFTGDAVLVRQSAVFDVVGVEFRSSGRYLEEAGFFTVFPYFKPREERLPRMRDGDVLEVVEMRLVEEETRPPERLSEAELLRVMEVNELGTDATRPLYPSLLLRRGFITRNRGRLQPTQLGEGLIAALAQVDERLVTPETRRTVERFMRSVERGEESIDDALSKALELYRPLLERCLKEVEIIGERLASHFSEGPMGGRRTPRGR